MDEKESQKWPHQLVQHATKEKTYTIFLFEQQKNNMHMYNVLFFEGMHTDNHNVYILKRHFKVIHLYSFYSIAPSVSLSSRMDCVDPEQIDERRRCIPLRRDQRHTRPFVVMNGI